MEGRINNINTIIIEIKVPEKYKLTERINMKFCSQVYSIPFWKPC
jgi:hypothetical protein